MGKGLHEAHVWAYFNQRNNKQVLVAKTMLTQVHMATPEQFELFLSSFDTSKARREWFRENTMANYKMLELHLKMDLQDGPSQLMHNYGTGGRLDASMSYALQLLVEEGRIEEVDWHKDFFVSPCFPKQKVGRKFEGTDLDLVRVLNDLRAVNARVLDTHEHWHINNPTREGIALDIPADTCWFGEVDLKDAFHWGKMHPDSKKYVVICWKGRLWRWNGCPQGLKPASAYFSSMVTQLLNTALGGAGAGAAANDGTPKGYQGTGAACGEMVPGLDR